MLSLKNIYTTLKEARKYKQLFIFMIVCFFCKDGAKTLQLTIIFFGQEELQMTSLELTLSVVLQCFFATIGNILYFKLQIIFDLTTKQIFVIIIYWYIILSIYPSIGFYKPLGFGLVTKTEFYLYSMVYGIQSGALGSYAKSIMSSLTPGAHESEIFSLYSIVTVGGIGSALIGVINQFSSMRYVPLYSFGTYLLSACILWFVDIEKGKKDSGRTGERFKKDMLQNMCSPISCSPTLTLQKLTTLTGLVPTSPRFNKKKRHDLYSPSVTLLCIFGEEMLKDENMSNLPSSPEYSSYHVEEVA